MSKIRLIQGKSLNVPIKLEQKFDLTGNEMAIEEFSDDVLQKIINPIKDYEVAKYIHDYDVNGDNDLYIDMYFTGQKRDYTEQGFDPNELVTLSQAAKKSFFKLDFFDTDVRETQKLQFTKIIPIYLSEEEDLPLPIDGRTKMIIPKFKSNFLKNNEISDFFIFKDPNTKDVEEFYMSCRFFNAKNGDVVRLVNKDTEDGINPSLDYYYRVEIDRQKRTYKIYETDEAIRNQRVGDINNPINFYEIL